MLEGVLGLDCGTPPANDAVCVHEDRSLARLRALRSDPIDPTIALRNGRVVNVGAWSAPGPHGDGPVLDILADQ